MAEGKVKCCDGCRQPHSLKNGDCCCPSNCKLCDKKQCKENKQCKCNECTCGCQLDQNKGKPCKESGCAGCVVRCKDAKKCRCTFCDCGCQNAFDKGELCHEKEHNKDCDKCQTKCKGSKDGTCICKLCNCGCDGINCQCCRWCNPETKCKGDCDRPEHKHDDGCPDQGGEKDGGKYYCEHDKEDGKCDVSKCNGATTYVAGNCRFKCTNCGRLCDQDRCMIWIRVIVIGLIILASVFVMRAMFPQKFHAITSKIRAAFPISSRHPDRPLSRLAGDRIPDEMYTNRYPAFRPRAYAGLA